jgi:hypothetical protein
LCALGFPAGSAAGGLALAVLAPSTVLLVAAGVCGLSSLVLLLVRVGLGEELRAADQNQ